MEEENSMNLCTEDPSTLDTVTIISKKISQSFGGLDALVALITGGEFAKQLDRVHRNKQQEKMGFRQGF